MVSKFEFGELSAAFFEFAYSVFSCAFSVSQLPWHAVRDCRCRSLSFPDSVFKLLRLCLRVLLKDGSFHSPFSVWNFGGCTHSARDMASALGPVAALGRSGVNHAALELICMIYERSVSRLTWSEILPPNLLGRHSHRVILRRPRG